MQKAKWFYYAMTSGYGHLRIVSWFVFAGIWGVTWHIICGVKTALYWLSIVVADYVSGFKSFLSEWRTVRLTTSPLWKLLFTNYRIISSISKIILCVRYFLEFCNCWLPDIHSLRTWQLLTLCIFYFTLSLACFTHLCYLHKRQALDIMLYNCAAFSKLVFL